MMTFTNSHEDLRGKTTDEVEYIVYEDANIHEIMQHFRRFLLATSFTSETVDQYIKAE